jgi:hypothetical protein
MNTYLTFANAGISVMSSFSSFRLTSSMIMNCFTNFFHFKTYKIFSLLILLSCSVKKKKSTFTLSISDFRFSFLIEMFVCQSKSRFDVVFLV